MHEEFPHYGWDSNKGYCAKAHREAVDKHGLTVHHRRAWSLTGGQLELAV
jgi:ribonuclease HII